MKIKIESSGKEITVSEAFHAPWMQKNPVKTMEQTVEEETDALLAAFGSALPAITMNRFIEKFVAKYMTSGKNQIRVIRAAHGELKSIHEK